MVTAQLPLPLHAPPQPAKLPALAVASRVTTVPSVKLARQLPLLLPDDQAQAIPAGEEVTVPPPVPAMVIASGCDTTGSKVAVTACALDIVT